MELSAVEPRAGDIVVIPASTAPGAQTEPGHENLVAVVEWAQSRFISERLSALPHQRGVIEARLCASERGRDAWDGSGTAPVRLPRLPLVYRSGPGTYTISVDVTDYADARAILRWKSTSHMSEPEVRHALELDQVPSDIAEALIGKAPMPEACA